MQKYSEDIDIPIDCLITATLPKDMVNLIKTYARRYYDNTDVKSFDELVALMRSVNTTWFRLTGYYYVSYPWIQHGTFNYLIKVASISEGEIIDNFHKNVYRTNITMNSIGYVNDIRLYNIPYGIGRLKVQPLSPLSESSEKMITASYTYNMFEDYYDRCIIPIDGYLALIPKDIMNIIELYSRRYYNFKSIKSFAELKDYFLTAKSKYHTFILNRMFKEIGAKVADTSDDYQIDIKADCNRIYRIKTDNIPIYGIDFNISIGTMDGNRFKFSKFILPYNFSIKPVRKID